MHRNIEEDFAIETGVVRTGMAASDAFAADVDKGLSSSPKTLSSKYFYDAEGDRLFQQIMQLDEYYLTRTEYSILDTHKGSLMNKFSSDTKGFHLMEFGAGDGYKTKILLHHFVENSIEFDYRPIDISDNALVELSDSLEKEIPSIHVEGMQGEYFEALERVKDIDAKRKIVLFLGSNIGNFDLSQATDFLSRLRSSLDSGDKVLIGFDLKKDPHVIRRAYDDPQGVTSAFNLNLLSRINRELKADFDTEAFKHFQSYNPTSGECRSYLISLRDQEVYVHACEKNYFFKTWEAIHVEVSRKFDIETIHELALTCGFEVEEDYFDENRFFVNSLWAV